MSRPTEMDQALDSTEPGSRRFRDLIARERHDMGWLVHVVAAMYDEISGGMISKPMTYPHEVIGQYEERLNKACDEAVAEERVRVVEAVGGLKEGQVRDHVTGRLYGTEQVSRAAVIDIVNDKEVTG